MPQQAGFDRYALSCAFLRDMYSERVSYPSIMSLAERKSGPVKMICAKPEPNRDFHIIWSEPKSSKQFRRVPYV